MNTSTITDWIQAVSSLFAAIGLVWTLLLQKKATDSQIRATIDQARINQQQHELNLQQKEINRLSMENDRRSIMPFFRIKEIDSKWNIYCSNATAFNLEIEYLKDPTLIEGKKYRLKEVCELDEVLLKMDTLDLENYISSGKELIFKLCFQDQVKRSYHQYLYIEASNFKIGYPIVD